ncbi:YcaO-like family protein [Cysteiniphilum halobium]|uniref:YcaO-like family protein n=1 Tax=Cysteiniphilum halobium TaxID=2219059 RepID=UPI0013C33F8B|nr:YcaO-like family protein [Cysteiniphilum halobium]
MSTLDSALRIKTPIETLEVIKAYLPKAKITRLANLTDLDDSNIPVYTSIRPLGKSLSTSQGKSFSHDAAKVSAYMEALELYFAEEVKAELYDKPFQQSTHFISPNQLSSNIIYKDDKAHNWCQSKSFLTDQTFYLPFQFVSINSGHPDVVIQATDTTGIASGNSYDEALVHSLLECIERKSATLTSQQFKLDIKHVFYDKIASLHHVELKYYANPYGVPVISCLIQSKDKTANQMVFSGHGAHLNKEIALNRALTEAIQSKVTTIAGSRDDLFKHAYEKSNLKLNPEAYEINFSDIPEQQTNNIANALMLLKSALKKAKQDALIHVYHDEELTFLKSILVKQEVIDNA